MNTVKYTEEIYRETFVTKISKAIMRHMKKWSNPYTILLGVIAIVINIEYLF